MLNINMSYVNCQYYLIESPVAITVPLVNINIAVCEFKSCYSDDFAGAIYIVSDAGFVSISNLYVDDCKCNTSAACTRITLNITGIISVTMASYTNSGNKGAMWGNLYEAHNIVSNVNWSKITADWEPAFHLSGLESRPARLHYACAYSCVGFNYYIAASKGSSNKIEYLSICKCNRLLYIKNEFLLENSNFYDNNCTYILSIIDSGVIKNCFFDDISMIQGYSGDLNTTSLKIPIQVALPVHVQSKPYRFRAKLMKSISVGLVPFFLSNFIIKNA